MTATPLRMKSSTAQSAERNPMRTARLWAVRHSASLRLAQLNLPRKQRLRLPYPQRTVVFLLRKYRMAHGLSMKSKARKVLYSPRKKSPWLSARWTRLWRLNLSTTASVETLGWQRWIRTIPTTSSLVRSLRFMPIPTATANWIRMMSCLARWPRLKSAFTRWRSCFTANTS